MVVPTWLAAVGRLAVVGELTGLKMDGGSLVSVL